MSEQKTYSAPEIRELGTVTELTQTGLTNEGDDGKVGSKNSRGQ